ncbi:hypothetical protein ACV22V_08180 [Burkholderia sp. AW33-5]
MMKPTNGMDRAQFHDKAWSLWHEKALDDAKLPKLSIHAIRTLWNVLHDSMPVEAANETAAHCANCGLSISPNCWCPAGVASFAASANETGAEAHKLLEALIDIYDDGQNNAPEDRCYAEGAWKEVIDEARSFLVFYPSDSTEPSSEVTSAFDAYKVAPVTLLEQQKRSIAERHFQGAPDVCRALKCIDEACEEMLTAARTGASS